MRLGFQRLLCSALALHGRSRSPVASAQLAGTAGVDVFAGLRHGAAGCLLPAGARPKQTGLWRAAGRLGRK